MPSGYLGTGPQLIGGYGGKPKWARGTISSNHMQMSWHLHNYYGMVNRRPTTHFAVDSLSSDCAHLGHRSDVLFQRSTLAPAS